VIWMMISFVFTLVISTVMSTVGGLIGAALFKKKLPPGTVQPGQSY